LNDVKRRLMKLCFALSLLLTLAAGALTISAAWRPRHVGHEWADDTTRVTRFIAIDSGITWLSVSWGSYEWPFPPQALVLTIKDEPLPADVFTVPVPDPPPAWWERIGFRAVGGDPFTGTGVTVPSWFAVGAPAVMTLALLRPLLSNHRYRARQRRGLCVSCAYDLRGAAHERCPECGEVVGVVARV
jgi:hypothetical protein